MAYSNILSREVNTSFNNNSVAEMLARGSGYHIEKELTLGGTGSQIVNMLQLTGTVSIYNQWFEITEVTTLTNLTALYITLYDGTNTVTITTNGAVLSGMPVGTFFVKDQLAANTLSVNDASQCRVLEVTDNKQVGRPFHITQKNGATTYLRLHYTTTDNPVNFKILAHFEYHPANGGTLAFL